MKNSFLKIRPSKARVLAVLLAVAALLTSALIASAASVGATDAPLTAGRDFSEREELQVTKDFDKMPKTYEAVVYVPKSVKTEGTIFGNYINLSTAHVNFSINASGQPKIYVHDQNGNQKTVSFSKDIRGEAWAHVVITHEPNAAGDVFKCYVNGELISTVTSEFNQELDMTVVQHAASLYLGQDFRNNFCFKGRIKDVAVYSSALSASEVSASYSSGINRDHSALMAYYDLSDKDDATVIPDSSANGNNIKPLYHERENELTLGEGEYSFAVVGDTQFLLDNALKNGTDYYSGIYDWITANKTDKNIVRYIGLGDITESNTPAEWEIAVKEFEKLENAGIPYTMTWGYSHDGLKGEEFTSYFGGRDNFDDAVPYSSNSNQKLTNYYQRFTVENTKYMILSLGWLPDADVLSWASEAIDTYSDHKVIIITHYYLLTDGTVSEEPYAIWNDLAANHENVIMVMSGHIHYAANIVRTSHEGRMGQTVTEMLINPQYMDRYYGYDSTGNVAMLYFSADGSQVRVEYISTTKTAKSNTGRDVFYGAKNQFTFTVEEPEDTLTTKYGTIPSDKMDVDENPFIIFSEEYDGEKWIKKYVGSALHLIGSNDDSGSAIGISKTYLKTNAYKNGSYGDTPIKINILLRRHYAMGANDSFNNFSQIQGEINIDLDGLTITAPASKAMFSVDLKGWDYSGDASVFPSTITMSNGGINVIGKDLIYYKNNNPTANEKEFTFNFNDITFRVSGATSKLISNGTISDQKVYAGANFTDCTIDLTACTASAINLFSISSNNEGAISFGGGSIITSSSILPKLNVIATTNSTVKHFTFCANAKGEYTTLLIPSGEVAPTQKFNGDTLYFEGGAASDGIITCNLVFKDSDQYGSVPAMYSSLEKYPFLVFDNEKKFIYASSYFYGNKASDSAINLAKTYLSSNVWNGSSYGNGEITAYVYVRCDVVMAANESYNNLSQIQGTLHIDLAGHTLSAPENNPLFPTDLKQWTGSGDESIFPSAISVKNGSIRTYNSELIYFSANANGTGKTFSYSFEKITFYVMGNAANLATKYAERTSPNLTASVDFTDCTVDITSASAGITLFDLGNESVSTTISFAGGNINAGNIAYTLTERLSGEGKLFFNKTNAGEYTVFTQSAAPSEVLWNESGMKLVFVSLGESSYTVMPDYTPKTSVTLYTDFKYNIYLPKTSALSAVSLNSEALDVSTLEVVKLGNEDFYKLPACTLKSFEALGDITLTVTLTDGADSYNGSFTLDLYSYANTVIASGSTFEKALAKDMLSYVSAAYDMWNKTSDKLASINTLLGEGYDASNAPDMNKEIKTPGTSKFESVTFYLGEAPAYRFYYSDTTAPSYTFKVGSRVVNTTLGSDNVEGNYVEVKVYAYELLKGISFTDGTNTYEYNVYSYYSQATDASVKHLVERLVKYCESANAYRESVKPAN